MMPMELAVWYCLTNQMTINLLAVVFATVFNLFQSSPGYSTNDKLVDMDSSCLDGLPLSCSDCICNVRSGQVQ